MRSHFALRRWPVSKWDVQNDKIRGEPWSILVVNPGSVRILLIRLCRPNRLSSPSLLFLYFALLSATVSTSLLYIHTKYHTLLHNFHTSSPTPRNPRGSARPALVRPPYHCGAFPSRVISHASHLDARQPPLEFIIYHNRCLSLNTPPPPTSSIASIIPISSFHSHTFYLGTP